MNQNPEQSSTLPTTLPEDGTLATTSEASQPVMKQPVTSPVFILSCLLLPVLWGVIVHLFFNKLRRNRRPSKLSETGWPDYQI